MSENEDWEINQLVREIRQLKVNTAREISRLEKEVQRNRTDKGSRSGKPTTAGAKASQFASGTVIVNRAPTSAFIVHQDRFGTEIYIGTKVKFLTQGKYGTTEGIVESSDSHWVYSRDRNGQKIKRSARSLKVLLYH